MEATLYHGRKEASAQGCLLPDGDQSPEGWTSRDKFAAVVETASLSKAELGEYGRRRGLYPEQIRAWRAACEQANDWDREQQRRLKESQQTDQKRLREMERELQHKEQALAEAAALLSARRLRSLEAAREWTLAFVRGYNREHRNSAIRYVTPDQRHVGDDRTILAARKRVYQAAEARHPERWTDSTRTWAPSARCGLIR